MRRHLAVRADIAPDVVRALRRGLSGFAAETVGPRTLFAWLRGVDGTDCVAWVESVDLEFKFEVFRLHMSTAAGCPLLVDGAPPRPPEQFEPWPFGPSEPAVLRRAEFVLEDADVEGTFGQNPSAQAAARPGQAPPEAVAACEVEVGLLFSAAGERLLIGADWAPMSLVVSREPAEIDAYLEACQLVPLPQS